MFVVFVPLLGVLVYMIVHGQDMGRRRVDDMIRADDAQREYIRSVASSSGGTADELTKLAQLRDSGVLTDTEFEAQKAKLLV